MALFAIIPAAGVGSRFGTALPKQYQPLLGMTVLEHSIQRLLKIPAIETLVVAIAQEDGYWSQIRVSQDSRIETVVGGKSRAESVWNALLSLQQRAHENDWVLVHDAVRPCTPLQDIERLITALVNEVAGGLLVTSVNETVKRIDTEGQVSATVDRDLLRLAQTPQLFRYRILKQALQTVREKGVDVTDEAMAVERLGYPVKSIAGSRSNIKITRLEDLELAQFYLSQMHNAENR